MKTGLPKLLAGFLAALLLISPLGNVAHAENNPHTDVESGNMLYELPLDISSDESDDSDLITETDCSAAVSENKITSSGEYIEAMSDGPGVDLLLSGFNVLSGQNLRRSNISIDFINHGALESFGINHWTGGTGVTASYFATRSMQSLASSKKVSTSFDLKTKVSYSGLFKASAEAKYSGSGSSAVSHTESLESFFSITEVSKDLGKNYINIADLEFHRNQIWESDVFSLAFKTALEKGCISDLFRNFGTHVITAYHFGGYAESTMTILKTDSSSEEGIEEKYGVSTNISGGGWGFEASIEANYNTASAIRRTGTVSGFEQRMNGYVSGGTQGHADAMDPNSSLPQYQTWLDSISASDPKNSTEVILNENLELVGIWELLPVELAERRMDIQEAYFLEASKVHNRFFDEFIYSRASIPAVNIPVPEYNAAFTVITNEVELNSIRNNPSDNYILANDITLTNNWTPIPTFTGILEGNSNTIRNVDYVLGSSSQNFIRTNTGIIRNLSIRCNARSQKVAGTNNGTVINTFVNGVQESNYIAPVLNPTFMQAYAGVSISIPNTHRHAQINFTGQGLNPTANVTITVPAGVETIRFNGNGSTYTRLNIVVQGDTVVILNNFRFSGHNLRENAFPALRFTGSNPTLISAGSNNTITGFGRYIPDDIVHHGVVEADGNLTIAGNANLTINHNNSLNSSGDGGKDGINVRGTLNIALDRTTLTATAGNGMDGAPGNTGTRGSDSTKNDGPAPTNGGEGGSGGQGGNAVTGIYAHDQIIISNSSTIIARGGNGGNGGQGGLGGQGGNSNYAGSGTNTGGIGGTGGRGGDGGRGGAGISTEGRIIILDDAVVQAYGGAAGTGGRGGNGGIGGWGNCWPCFGRGNNGGDGGRGGHGGNGGDGGKGGNPLNASSFNLNQHQSQFSSLRLHVGQGASGGDGGTGGTGGMAGSRQNIFYSNGTRGTGGNGGRGGDGGWHGHHTPVPGGITESQYGASGGSEGSEGLGGTRCHASDSTRGSSGKPGDKGTTRTARPASIALELSVIGTASMDMWGRENRILFNGSVNRIQQSIHQGTLVYHMGETFDIDALNMTFGGNPLLSRNVQLFYNFSEYGNTLVTVVHFTAGGRNIRYIPVKVVPAEVERVELVLPQQRHFRPGSVFNHDGLALEIHYCGGGFELVLPSINDLSFPDGATTENITVRAGIYTMTVMYIDKFGAVHTPSYSIIVSDTPESIEVIRKPNQTEYYVGQLINSAGMEIRQRYHDGTYAPLPIDLVEFSPTPLDRIGENVPVTVTYRVTTVEGNQVDLVDIFLAKVLRDEVFRHRILNLPQVIYFEDDWVNPDGLILEAEWLSGRVERVPIGAIVFTPNRPLDRFDDRITWRYTWGTRVEDFISSEISINVEPHRQEGIQIVSSPVLDKILYWENEPFESAGLEVWTVWNDLRRNKKLETDEYTLSIIDGDRLRVEDSLVTVTQNNTVFVDDFIIIVRKIEVEYLRVSQQPVKNEYLEGETFNSTGMEIEVKYNNADEYIEVTDYTYSPDGPLSVNDREVVVSYGGLSDRVEIRVEPRPRVATPTSDTESGFVERGTLVTLTSETENAVIRYTMGADDSELSEPTEVSVEYTEPIEIIEAITTIKTRAFMDGMVDSGTSTFTYITTDAPMITVGEASGVPGTLIEVPITLSNNPGITSMLFSISFDDTVLRLVGTPPSMNTGLLEGHVSPAYIGDGASPVAFAWNDMFAEEDNQANGEIAILVFEIVTDSPPGEYTIIITPNYENIINFETARIPFLPMNGIVVVPDIQYGDVNEDFSVTFADATLTNRFVAGWPNILINLDAADVNSDSSVTFADATIINRHVAGWLAYGILPYLPSVPVQQTTYTHAEIFMSVSNETPMISITNKTGTSGSTVSVPISIENNTGIVGLKFTISFDDTALRLVGTPTSMNTGLLRGHVSPSYTGAGTSPIVLAWNDMFAEENNTANGEIAILEFMILEDTIPDEYTITITPDYANFIDFNMNMVYFTSQNGSITIPPEHLEGEGTVTTEPTCEEKGVLSFYCTECDHLIRTEDIPALGHDFIVVTVEATCTEDGSVTTTCSRCDYEDIDVLPILGHDYIVVTVEATCTEEGSVTTTCSRYDYEDIDVLPALGHDFTILLEHEDATCKDGNDLWKCSRCDKTKTDVLPATGVHTWVGGDTTEPTCTEEGFTVYECSVCKDAENFDLIPALGHDYIVITVEATCTEDGSETTTCSRCDYEDIDVLPALGHDFSILLGHENATCVEEGHTIYGCSRCDEVKTDTIEIDPENHSGGTYDVVITQATCAVKGVMGIFCDDCSEVAGIKPIEKDPENHSSGTYEVVIVPATFELEGLVEVCCLGCDAILYEEITPKMPLCDDHEYVGAITREATCAEKGELTVTCSICHHIYTEPTEKDLSNHVGGIYDTILIKATCTDEGEIDICCAGCDTLLDTKSVPELGHDYGLVGHEDATCEDDGYYYYECSRCEETKTDVISAFGHTEDDGVETLAPTLSATGVMTYTCTICGKVVHTEEIPRIGVGSNEESDYDTNTGGTGGSPSGGGNVQALVLAPITPVVVIEDDETPLTGWIIPTEWENPFVDVVSGDWFYDAVAFANANGLMNGTDEGLFSPVMNLSRAMVVTILWRMEGEPTDIEGIRFTDVRSDQWYAKAVAWASANEIVAGYDDGLFRPEDDITREQLAAILLNYARYKRYDITDSKHMTAGYLAVYADLDLVSDWATDAVKWANSLGFISGRTNTTLDPKGIATRAEAAAILQRFVIRITVPPREEA